MVVVSGVSYVLGERKPISEISELVGDAAAVQFLRERGFAAYTHSVQEPWQLAAAAVEQTFARCGVGPADIDEVLYATTSSMRSTHEPRGDQAGDGDEGVGAFASATGLMRAPITGVCFGECANCMMALELGAMFLETRRAKRVLLVSTDVARTRQDRLPLGGTGVCGDGAVACVMSHEPPGGRAFELTGYAKKFHHAARAGLAPSPGQLFRELCMGVRACKDTVLPTLGGSPVARWIPNNSNLEVISAMGSVVGLRSKDFYFDNLARNGHVFSADQLINLVDWAEATATPGDCAVGLATGVSVCVAAGWRVL
jgi:3-oxoacyl-[acyl-carrier-protein] synthase III